MFKKNVDRTWSEWLCTVAAAFLGFVLFSPETFDQYQWINKLAQFAALGGLTVLGIGNVKVVRRK